MKRLHLTAATLACILSIFTSYARCAEDRVQPVKSKAAEQTLNEAKSEHAVRVAGMRAKLPLLKKQLLEEKNHDRRETIVSALGETEDSQSIAPLMEVLQNVNENSRVREVSAEALYALYRPGLASGKSLAASDRQKILIPMKEVYSKEQNELKCVLADKLYKMGEKEFVVPGIKKCLKAERWPALNTFYYTRVVDGVMINTILPGEKTTTRIDTEATAIIREASGSDYPEKIRVKAANMLFLLGEKDAAFKSAKDIVENGKVYDCRSDAMLLMSKIGTPEAKAVLESAQNKPELKRFAEQILKWVWGK